MMPLDRIADAVLERGDLAHLALFLWASGALGAANRRFDVFVRELALFNRRHGAR